MIWLIILVTFVIAFCLGVSSTRKHIHRVDHNIMRNHECYGMRKVVAWLEHNAEHIATEVAPKFTTTESFVMGLAREIEHQFDLDC